MLALAEAEPRASSSPLSLAARTSAMSVTWSGGPVYGIKAFTGREWDPEIGLYYYRARYYDPKVGRFISEDPIQQRNYLYGDNTPIRYVDPSGLLKVDVVCTRHRITFLPELQGGHGKMITRRVDVTYSCSCEDAQWKPSFTVTGTCDILYLPESLAHELRHELRFRTNVMEWAADLVAAEHVGYDSKRDCEEAAARAKEDLLEKGRDFNFDRGQCDLEEDALSRLMCRLRTRR